MEITRPLLAGTLEKVEDIIYPVLVTPKLDGIRCLIVNGKAMTRNFKPIPNIYIRTWLEDHNLPNGLDGEIMIKDNKDFSKIQSEVMSFAGRPDFFYTVFDFVKDDLSKPYSKRMKDLAEWFSVIDNETKNRINALLPTEISTEQVFLGMEDFFLKGGCEGIMLRKADGPYKCGRSTLKERILLKFKRFSDSEAIILDFVEKLTNTNEQEENEFGLSKRSSKKEGKVPAGTLGAIKVMDCKTKLEFEIGTGFDDELRSQIWENREFFKGKKITYKFQNVGIKTLPRFPVFKAFRED